MQQTTKEGGQRAMVKECATEEELDKMLEVKKLFDNLVAHFKIEPPRLIWSNAKAGHFTVKNRQTDKTGEIHIGLKSWYQMPIAALVHEFAHALVWTRYHHFGHDLDFVETLREVVLWTYRDIRNYPWRYEYSTITNWARSKGYSE
jgi:hypothetical protein